MKVKLFTDSEPTLELIASSRQVERKILRPTILDLKERLVDKDIHSYSWLPTQSMLGDVSTKEMKIPEEMGRLLEMKDTGVNKVKMIIY